MITKEDIDRINFLAKKSKDAGLTEEEKAEQQRLRRKYIDWVKSQVKAQLDTIEITDSQPDCGCEGHEHKHKHGHGCNCHKN
ncbi:hypothetical protein SDC9_127372 [bioreactor metagenome]|uniref:Uncharacterized protein n=1 Tax=bioreactor metagenome TaxID=1076179 RepID=A0A645CTW1_9ZZZZ|nr:DUF896 domain-containing protein [Lutispora sp.]MEA4962169.1 DUF896 domain-containing protein [Lutispora sp.]HCJ57298.1 DUF896 family protein [Clostridiaceae bacterium]